MDQTKGFFASKTIWGGLIVIIAAIAGLFGYTISADDQTALLGYLDNAALIAGGLLTIWGRITASKKIG